MLRQAERFFLPQFQDALLEDLFSRTTGVASRNFSQLDEGHLNR